MASALFEIDPGTGTYGAAGVAQDVSAAGATVNCRIANLSGVDPTQIAWTIFGTHSGAAPAITLSGTPTGQIASFTVPAGADQAYGIRLAVNGGAGTTYGDTKTSAVYVLNAAGRRPFFISEAYEADSTYGIVPRLNSISAAAIALSDLDWRPSVRAATHTALPANTRAGNVLTANAVGALTAQDGVTLVAGDDLLVQLEGGGASHANNGVYTIVSVGSAGTAWSMVRRADMDVSAAISCGVTVSVEEGTRYAGFAFVLVTPNTITLNTTALQWEPTVAVQLAKLPYPASIATRNVADSGFVNLVSTGALDAVTVGNTTGDLAIHCNTYLSQHVGGALYSQLGPTTFQVGKSNADYGMVLGQDSTNTVLRTFTVRGANNVAGGGKGESLALYPGAGNTAYTDDGLLTLNGAQALATNQVTVGESATTALRIGDGDANPGALVLGEDGQSFTVRRESTIRGADTTAVNGIGNNLIIKPGQGQVAGLDGYVWFQNARGTASLYVWPSALVGIGTTGGGAWVYFEPASTTHTVPSYYTNGAALALASTSILFGTDSATGGLAASTGIIRGADHSGAGASGVDVVIRPGAGGAGGVNGVVYLKDHASNALWQNYANTVTYGNSTARHTVSGSDVNVDCSIYLRSQASTYTPSTNTIVGGADRIGGAAVAASTFTIRGASHTGFANSQGTGVNIYSGKGNTAADDGVLSLYTPGAGFSVLEVTSTGALMKGKWATQIESIADGGELGDDNPPAYIVTGGGVGTVILCPASPVSGVFYRLFIATDSILLDGNGKTFVMPGGATSAKVVAALGASVFVLYDGTNWRYWSSLPAPGRAIVFADSPYTVDTTYYDDMLLVNPTGGSITINLPAVASNKGRRLRWKDTGNCTPAKTITFDGNAAETIDGAATYPVSTAYASGELYCDGTGWWML